MTQEPRQDSQKSNRYSGPEDIYHELVDDPNNSWLFGLLAFAVVEEQKIEWIKHHTQFNSTPPTPEQITAWYQQQPPGILLRAKGTAENALQVYSREVLEELENDIRKRVEESVTISEIRDLKRFWPQFGMNLAGGFISSLLFALVLVALTVVVFNDPSPVGITRKFNNPPEVPHDVQEN